MHPPAPPSTSQHSCPPRPPTAVAGGIAFHAVSREVLCEQVGGFIDCGEAHVVHFLSVDPTVVAQRDADYRRALQTADLTVADGLPVKWVLNTAGLGTERIAGTESMEILPEWGLSRDAGHFFYGGSPEVRDRLPAVLAERHPGIRITGAVSPPYRPLTDEEIVEAAEQIADAGTDILWIGLGTPAQHVVGERLRQLGAAPVIVCVGAAFDFTAGVKQRAPRWMQRTGLEWAHRLASEPRRLWRRYLIGNPLFVKAVVAERRRARRERRR